MNDHQLTVRGRSNRLLTVLIAAMTTMLFAAFTGAYLIRRTSGEWTPVELPGVLLVTSGVIVLSSVVLEIARRRSSIGLLRTTIGLAVLFLAGQGWAWRDLVVSGQAGADAMHGTFITTLCAVHAAHLIGGIIALAYALRRPALLSTVAMWWHFVGVVWLYVYALLACG